MWVITGNRGFVGSQLSPTVDHIGYDLKDGKDIYYPEPMKGDVLVNLAAISGIGACEKAGERAIRINALAAERMCRLPFRRRLMASSQAAGAPHLYGLSKQCMEALCRKYPRTVLMRFSNIYGPGSVNKTSCVAQWFKDALKKGRILVHGNGLQERDFIYVDDVVNEIHRLAESDETGVTNVVSGVTRPILSVALIIQGITNCDMEVEDYSTDVFPADDMYDNLYATYEYFKSQI